MRSLAAAVVCAALFGACDDDALPEFTCWPSIAPIPRGTVELGKGGTSFSEMPDTLNLEYGIQGGFMVKVWNRMTGFLPGTGEFMDAANPFTRVRARFVDSDLALQLPGNCAERVTYVPNSVGGYDYPSESAMMFDTCWGKDMLVGKQLEITAELMDATGSYATDSKIITIADELDPSLHNAPTTPGCGM